MTGRAAAPAHTTLRLETGALLPRSPVRDETGRPVELLAALEGRPSVLLCLARPRSPAARQAARAVAELASDVPRLARVLLLPDDARGADVVELAGFGLQAFVALSGGVPEGPDQSLLVAFTDAAGRILRTGALRASRPGQLGGLLRAAFAGADDAPRHGPLAHTAPVLIITDVLPEPLCRQVVEHFERDGGRPSGILDLSGPTPQWRPDPAVKRRRDLTLEDPDLIRQIEQAVAAKVLPEIRKCFHYVVTHHEPFKLVCYEEGSGYFRPHRDNETNDTLYRRFAMTINLNTGEFDGGAVQFPEFGTQTYRPPRGGAIVFSCSLLHEATDVTRGRRYAVLGFFYNPDDGLEGTRPR